MYSARHSGNDFFEVENLLVFARKKIVCFQKKKSKHTYILYMYAAKNIEMN